MENQKSGRGRTRSFATVVYPESAPENWQSVLEEQFVPAFISPLHDQDLNPGGEKKKAHYHVIIMFDGVKTDAQAKELFDKIGGVGCEKIQSIRGYARYLCHLDNPEKAQYDQAMVRSLCGADYIGTIGLAYDKYKALSEMEEFCERYDVNSYYVLARYASVNRSDWSRILKDCGTVYMREYLQSRKWSRDNGLNCIADPITGEIVFDLRQSIYTTNTCFSNRLDGQKNHRISQDSFQCHVSRKLQGNLKHEIEGITVIIAVI